MELRAELLPPTEPSRMLRAQIRRAMDIEAHDGAVAAATWLRTESGVDVSPSDLQGWSASMDADQVARNLIRPAAHELRKLAVTRAELIEITRRWLPTSPAYDGEHEEWWIAIFEANVPRPGASTAAFYPPEGVAEEDITPEWIVDHALSYRSIEL